MYYLYFREGENDVNPLATRFEMDKAIVSYSGQPTLTNERTGNIVQSIVIVKIRAHIHERS